MLFDSNFVCYRYLALFQCSDPDWIRIPSGQRFSIILPDPDIEQCASILTFDKMDHADPVMAAKSISRR